MHFNKVCDMQCSMMSGSVFVKMGNVKYIRGIWNRMHYENFIKSYIYFGYLSYIKRILLLKYKEIFVFCNTSFII